ncbi:hypothetical protein, partial [Klebsiella pneumoniae]|uniref:hypothetical protein n=1 Tax=Klebsiella pneumoniae TaxID=573 RepID=UPI003D805541
LAAILEEPPRGGLVDLGAVFSRQQANWQQRSQQLMKRLARRGGQPDAGLMAGGRGRAPPRPPPPPPRAGGGG